MSDAPHSELDLTVDREAALRKAGGAAGPYSGDADTLEPIELSILIDARPETVFSLLADTERFGAWMGSLSGTFEPTAGTSFEMLFPQFGITIAGEVLDLVENEKLTLTWGVAEGPQAESVPAGSTTVEISLAPEGSSTRVTLRHSDLPTLEEWASHEAGWKFHFFRLSLLANRAALGAALEAVASAYFGAWNETDPKARLELLRQSCAADVAFVDEYADSSGIERLSVHIGNSQMFMPGFRLEPDGEPSICLSEVLLPWKTLDAEGNVTNRGHNFAEVSPERRFSRIKGFWV